VRGSAFEPPAKIQVTPSTLDFGALHQGTSATLPFEIRNIGDGPLRLNGATPFLASYCYAQTDLTVPATILPGQAMTANVTFRADLTKQTCSSFYFTTNDPASSVVFIQINATILSPQIYFAQSYIQFPDTALGAFSTVRLTARNLAAEPLIISKATINYNPSFVLATPLPLTIPGNGSFDLEFVFYASYLGGNNGYALLETNDLQRRQVYIDLFANAVMITPARAPASLR